MASAACGFGSAASVLTPRVRRSSTGASESKRALEASDGPSAAVPVAVEEAMGALGADAEAEMDVEDEEATEVAAAAAVVDAPSSVASVLPAPRLLGAAAAADGFGGAAAAAASFMSRALITHGRRFLPVPPNLTLSRQNSHLAHSMLGSTGTTLRTADFDGAA